MISKIRILIAFGVVVCLAGSVHADDATIMFPGEHKCAASSNHVFDICNYGNERDTDLCGLVAGVLGGLDRLGHPDEAGAAG